MIASIFFFSFWLSLCTIYDTNNFFFFFVNRAKLAHLEEVWFVLQKERAEVEDMKQELFRERIEIAKIKLQYQPDDDDEHEDVKDIKIKK